MYYKSKQTRCYSKIEIINGSRNKDCNKKKVNK